MNIFLTGATGFLGGKLIRQLLDKGHSLHILARNIDKAERLIESVSSKEQHNITIYKGDITGKNLGLTNEAILNLTNNVDVFYHLAALVKFDEELRDTLMNINLQGTKEALAVAKKLGVKKFFHVSTAYTVGTDNVGYESLSQPGREFFNPYEESKALAEHEVFDMQEEMEVSIFRPSIIVGDSKTGEADSEFTLYGFMRGLEVFKKRLERKNLLEGRNIHLIGTKDGTSNLVPVDYVADILALAIEKAEKNKIYHITNPVPKTNQQILETIKQHLEFGGLQVLEVEKASILTKEEIQLNGMIKVFQPYLDRHIKFHDENTQQFINGTNISHLNMTDEMLNIIISAYFQLNKEKVTV
ncbi:SDR family oxidoreductase [Bacillus alkalisoli]|uniref:SDR family oxidoreductase n=1 Tax=Bacillus alkalisoli TaxID=2011008 RepID=UPI000C246AD9|nr:SDR family oxidoreductase [Bacillus alkalisoli]